MCVFFSQLYGFLCWKTPRIRIQDLKKSSQSLAHSVVMIWYHCHPYFMGPMIIPGWETFVFWIPSMWMFSPLPSGPGAYVPNYKATRCHFFLGGGNQRVCRGNGAPLFGGGKNTPCKLTQNALANRPGPKRKQSYFNHPFSGAFAVSFREGTLFFRSFPWF